MRNQKVILFQLVQKIDNIKNAIKLFQSQKVALSQLGQITNYIANANNLTCKSNIAKVVLFFNGQNIYKKIQSKRPLLKTKKQSYIIIKQPKSF